MKRIILVMMFMFLPLFALGSLSSISSDEKLVLDGVLKNLSLSNISDKQKREIYDAFSFAFEDDWYTTFNGNDALKISKLDKESVKFCTLKIVNKNRLVDFVFIWYPNQKQLFVNSNQYVSAESDLILDKFEEYKKNSEENLLNESNNYGFFRKKGFLSETIMYVDGKSGLVNYSRYQILEIK
jgi:hypothetical protein